MFYTLVIQFNVNKEKEREERKKQKKTDYYFFFSSFHLILNITKKPGEYMNELVPSVPPLRLDDSS